MGGERRLQPKKEGCGGTTHSTCTICALVDLGDDGGCGGYCFSVDLWTGGRRRCASLPIVGRQVANGVVWIWMCKGPIGILEVSWRAQERISAVRKYFRGSDSTK